MKRTALSTADERCSHILRVLDFLASHHKNKHSRKPKGSEGVYSSRWSTSLARLAPGSQALGHPTAAGPLECSGLPQTRAPPAPLRTLRGTLERTAGALFVNRAPGTQAAWRRCLMNELTFVPGSLPEGRGVRKAAPRGLRGSRGEEGDRRPGRAQGPAFFAASPPDRSPAGSRLLTSPPGTPARRPTRVPPAAAEASGSSSASFQPAPPGVPPEAGRFLARAAAVPGSSRKPRLRSGVERWEQMETPAKQHLCRLAAPPAPSPPHRSGQGGRGAWTAGARGEAGHAGSRARGARTRGEPGRPGRTHPRDSSSVAGRASLAAAEPAGRAGKERPEPSGSLPWDTSCSALGPGRSPHLSGSLPRPPAEVCAGGDIRHPRPGPAGAARSAPPRPAGLRAPRPGRPARVFAGPARRGGLDDPGPARRTRAGGGRAGGRTGTRAAAGGRACAAERAGWGFLPPLLSAAPPPPGLRAPGTAERDPRAAPRYWECERGAEGGAPRSRALWATPSPSPPVTFPTPRPGGLSPLAARTPPLRPARGGPTDPSSPPHPFWDARLSLDEARAFLG
ncbi:collagen alpha-1(I) chain-like [Meles meles]|uniref:collagen alpha-1(I) chain-like n=1 Tax=Meles meles TaxID=9662 RepID=UPI001E69AF91|nr:collagen alpha-1(I) chain-like [Meles meles]